MNNNYRKSLTEEIEKTRGLIECKKIELESLEYYFEKLWDELEKIK